MGSLEADALPSPDVRSVEILARQLRTVRTIRLDLYLVCISCAKQRLGCMSVV